MDEGVRSRLERREEDVPSAAGERAGRRRRGLAPYLSVRPRAPIAEPVAHASSRSTAHDLSTHVANKTLSAHIASLQSALPPHSNLFILLYGLVSLFRDLERVRQEAYRNSIRAGGADGAEAAKAAKPAGIGERQPSKDELELELMRCVSLTSPVGTRSSIRRVKLTAPWGLNCTGFKSGRAA